MEKNKQEILNKISSAIESVFADLFLVQRNIENKNKELNDVTSKVSLFYSVMEEAQKELDKDKVDLNRKLNNFEKEKQDFEAEKARHESKVLADIELTKKEIAKRDSLKKEISELSTQIEVLKSKEQLAGAVLLDVKNKQEQVALLNSEIDSLKKEHDRFLTSFVKEKNDCMKELNDIKEKISLEKSIVLPKLKEVEEREAVLKDKENSLSTVIDRYQKLYAEKGAGFRI